MSDVLIWTGIGALGGLGALARYAVTVAVSVRRPGDFPLGTLAVNLSGTFVLGLLVGASVGDDALRLLGVGFLGGYTTFSTWMVETEILARRGQGGLAWLNVAAPTLAGLAAATAGWALGALL